MKFTPLDDTALLAVIAGVYGVKSSNPTMDEAISELYDRYGRLVFTIAVHIVGDTETAEEITQDVFLRICENARSFRPEVSKFTSWMASITRHRAIDELRRREVRPEKDRTDWPDDVGLDTIYGLPLSNGPEEAVEDSIQQQFIREIIATLPAEQRIVLGMAFFKGLSHSEIAEQLGEPLGTVKSRVRMALQKLRDAMIERKIID